MFPFYIIMSIGVILVQVTFEQPCWLNFMDVPSPKSCRTSNNHNTYMMRSHYISYWSGFFRRLPKDYSLLLLPLVSSRCWRQPWFSNKLKSPQAGTALKTFLLRPVFMVPVVPSNLQRKEAANSPIQLWPLGGTKQAAWYDSPKGEAAACIPWQ